MPNIEMLRKQVEFVAEVDKLKSVLRKTAPIGCERFENSAEHSWQVILCALLFEEHANEPVDILTVVKMLAIHDVVEIDVGDTFHYAKEASKDLYEQELAAAKRGFGLLPEEQGQALLDIWVEFEERRSPEARYAAAIDRMIAIMINARSEGGSWVEHAVTGAMILEKNAHIQEGSLGLWMMVQEWVQESCAAGTILSA